MKINPFKRKDKDYPYGSGGSSNNGGSRRTTPEGEPLEDPHGSPYSRGSAPSHGRISNPLIKIVIPAVIGIIIVAIAVTGSVKIVEAGYRGVLLSFGAVDTTKSLEEGIHFVVPVRDTVVPMEVRTQKIIPITLSLYSRK